MGTTLSNTLNIALSALQTSQTTLSTISHNISNVNTEGYTRQTVVNGNVALEGYGGGVAIDAINQITDPVLKARLTDQISAMNYHTAQGQFLDNLEVIFGTPGSDTSFEKIMGGFFNDVATLANSPDSSSIQLEVVKNAEFIVDTLNKMYQELNEAQFRADAQIDNAIVDINKSIVKINELNTEIVALGVGSSRGGTNANDLIDARQREIDNIAQYMNVNVTYDELGRAVVVSEAGRRLVDTSYVQLERTSPAPGETFSDIGTRPIGGDGQPVNIVFPLLTDRMTDGALKGLIDIRDGEMLGLKEEINNLAAVMIDAFNNIHSQGTSIPPLNSLTSGNGNKLSGPGADLTAELNINVGDSFDISIVDIATGNPISTTFAAGGGTTSITITASPTTLNDVAAAINANPDIGADVTASVVIDANGDQQLQITANNSSYGVVLNNNTGNVLGALGMNNFFTGTSAEDISIRDDILANPARIATANMRESDGGVSFLDNRNVTALAKLAEESVSFGAAGSLSAQSSSLSEYYISISSNFAIRLQESAKSQDFNAAILNDFETRLSNIQGVNIDEELSNLLVFQRSYQASARIISVVDELYETLVNIV